MINDTIEIEVCGHLMEVEFTFIAGVPATNWEPAEPFELDIVSFKLTNVENETWSDDEPPELFLDMPDTRSEIYEILLEKLL